MAKYTLKVHVEREEAFIRSSKLYTKTYRKLEDEEYEFVFYEVEVSADTDLFYFGQNVETSNTFIKWHKQKKEDEKRKNQY